MKAPDRFYREQHLFEHSLLGFAKKVLRHLPTDEDREKAVDLLNQLVDLALGLKSNPPKRTPPKKTPSRRAPRK